MAVDLAGPARGRATRARILHVSQPVSHGVAAVVEMLTRYQVTEGHDVVVASPRGPLAAMARRAGAHWCEWPAGRSPGSQVVREVRRLGAIVSSVGPDVLHLHSSKAGLVGRLAVRGSVPTLFQPHAWSFEAAEGFSRRLSLHWERYAVRWTTALLGCSREELRQGRDHGVHPLAAVVLNGTRLPSREWIDDARVHARAELGLGPTAPVVGLPGRVCRQKGQDVALTAWPSVLSAVPDATLVVIGDGPEANRLRSVTPPNVVFLGHRQDVRRVLAACDVVALPSRWEGLSLSLLEAMASGRAIVATAVSGTAATLGGVSGPACGRLVPAADDAALAVALIEVLNDPVLARDLGNAARDRVRELFSEHATARAVQTVTRAAIELSTGRARASTPPLSAASSGVHQEAFAGRL